MNVSTCILVLTLMIVWLCPYQINKWNYDFCYVTVIVTRQPFRVGVLQGCSICPITTTRF
ncbi:hypothetical protein HanRHA438_Chr08g0371621 [Helianthus annuus]|nr:hypothetical protein HanRHA438_Chr08g0371621 [Helianthus annuus]